MIPLDDELAELWSMSPGQLRAAWRECWRKAAPAAGPDVLRRGIAWKLQSRVHGQMPTAARRELDAAIDRLRRGEGAISARTRRLKPGTRLVREWRGRTHHIIVLEDCFEHEGRRYKSLTQIASAITGVHWSGPAFFGLKKRPSVARKATA